MRLRKIFSCSLSGNYTSFTNGTILLYMSKLINWLLNSTKFIVWSESKKKKIQNSELIFNNFLVATLSTELNEIWWVRKLVKTTFNGMSKMLMYVYKKGWMYTSQKLGKRGDAEIRLFFSLWCLLKTTSYF